jgi:hypothetical protein
MTLLVRVMTRILFTIGNEQATRPAVVAALRDARVEVMADPR